MRVRVYFLLSLICLHTVSAVDIAERQVKLFYGLAQGNYLIGDDNRALNELNEILRINPDYSRAYLLKARIYLDRLELPEALDNIEQAIAIEPNNLEAQLLKALILRALDRKKEALKIVRSVVSKAEANSRESDSASELLSLLLLEDDSKNPVEHTEENPSRTTAKIHNNIQKIDLQAVEKALASLDAILAEHPMPLKAGDVSGFKNKQGEQRLALELLKARLLSQTGKVDASITVLENLKIQYHNNTEVLLLLASLYTIENKWGLLETIIDPIARNPELSDIALYLSGRVALGQNRVGRARAQFEAALEKRSTENSQLMPSLYFYRGVCLSRLDRYSEAKEEIINALEAGFRPLSPRESLLVCKTMLLVGLYDQAIPILEILTLKGIQATPEVWSMLGRAQSHCGELKRAISAYNESLRMKSKQPEVLALRAGCFRQIGDLEGAIKDYTEALSLTPKNQALYYPLALSYMQLGNLLDAREKMKLASKHEPQRSDLSLWLAMLHYMLSDLAYARVSLDTYFDNCGNQPASSAHYLNYCLQLATSPTQALEVLEPHAKRSLEIGYFYAYCIRNIDTKVLLSNATNTPNEELASAQLCATLFWIAQHDRITGQANRARDFLNLALKTNAFDQAEYQFAIWQLTNW